MAPRVQLPNGGANKGAMATLGVTEEEHVGRGIYWLDP